jgi:hypothetical protein
MCRPIPEMKWRNVVQISACFYPTESAYRDHLSPPAPYVRYKETTARISLWEDSSDPCNLAKSDPFSAYFQHSAPSLDPSGQPLTLHPPPMPSQGSIASGVQAIFSDIGAREVGVP